MRVFLTGGSGYIGRNLLDLLLMQGMEVHVLSRSPLDIESGLNGWVIPHQGDILDYASLREGMRTCTHAFHLAGYAKNWSRDPGVFEAVNVTGTRNVIRAAAECGVQRIVLTSSVLALGFSNGHPLREDEAHKGALPTLYARSKRKAEHVALRRRCRRPEVVVVNPSRVYGPGRMTEGNSVTRMIRLHLSGMFPFLLGDGSAVGNYAHVRDVARGHLLAMERGRDGERYILGGENVSFREFFGIIGNISGTRHFLAGIPERLSMAMGRFEECRARYLGGYPTITPGWVRTFLLDGAYSSEKAMKELGYTVTPLESGLAETIAWLQAGNRCPRHEPRGMSRHDGGNVQILDRRDYEGSLVRT